MARPRKQHIKLRTFAGDLARRLREHLRSRSTIVWPDPRFKDNPVLFAEKILGIRCWDRQAEMVMAPVTHTYTAVRSGRRTGKSTSFAILALWRFCSFERGQVMLSSTTGDQLDITLWGEIARLHALSGLCADCIEKDPNMQRPCPHSAVIDGVMGGTSKSGLRSADRRYPRWIRGKTGKTAVSVQGFGHPDGAVLLDECSGIPDEVYPGFTGALASGGILMIAGNPNYRNGFFADAFKSKRYHKIQISSRESPNVKAGKILVPGLATVEWIEAEIEEHGEGSAHVAIHIDGEFASAAAGGVISFDQIEAAYKLHKTPGTDGVLMAGIDPATDSDSGNTDDTVITIVRGNRMLACFGDTRLSPEDILDTLLEMLAEHRRPGEVPLVKYDSEAEIGSLVGDALKVHQRKDPSAFKATGVRGWKRIDGRRSPFLRIRDELAGVTEKWLRAGGSLIPAKQLGHQKLEEDLLALRWYEPDRQGKQRLVEKRILKKALKRSPDYYDSLSTCLFDAGEGNTREMVERQLQARQERAQQQTRGSAPDRQWRRQEKRSVRSFYGK